MAGRRTVGGRNVLFFSVVVALASTAVAVPTAGALPQSGGTNRPATSRAAATDRESASWPPAGTADRLFLVRDDGALLAIDVAPGERRQHQVAPPCDACAYVGGSLGTPDGRRVLVMAQRGPRRWAVALDPRTERAVWRVPVGAESLFTTSPGGGLIYLLDDATRTHLTALDAGNGGRRGTVTLAHRAEQLSPDRSTGYALDRGTGVVTSVDLTTGASGPVVAVGDVSGWALSPDGRSLLVSRMSPDAASGCAWQSCRTEFQSFDLATGEAGATIRHDAQSILQAVTPDGRGLVVLPVAPKVLSWYVIAAPDGPTVTPPAGIWQSLAGEPTTVTGADGGSVLVRSVPCYYDCYIEVMQTVPATGNTALSFSPLGNDLGGTNLLSPSVAPLDYPLPPATPSPGPVPAVTAVRSGVTARIAWGRAARAGWYQTRMSEPGGSFDPYQPWTSWRGRQAVVTGLKPGRPYRVQVRAMGPGGTGRSVTVRLPR